MASLLIDDGYTFDGLIEARGPWPAVHFRYRPCLPEGVYDFLRGKRDTGKQSMRATMDMLMAHLVAWDITDPRGDLVPIRAEFLARLPHPVLERMLDHVTGYSAPESISDAKN
jgi:hypothetical protein